MKKQSELLIRIKYGGNFKSSLILEKEKKKYARNDPLSISNIPTFAIIRG